MRSDEIKYGTRRAPNRALLRSLGITDTEMSHPFIGIANAWNTIVPGHIHLRSLSEKVREGVTAGGGVPFEFGVIGICDGIAMGHEGMRYSLPSREVIADSIELMVQAHRFDGLVCVGTCDKIVPGMLMAAARLNIPAILLTGGPMEPGHLEGREITLTDIFEGVGMVADGSLTEEGLHELECCAMPGCGSCQGLYTANTMACLTEAMGMSLPGCAAIPAVHAAKLRIAKETGERIPELVRRGIAARDIITMQSIRNAIRVDMALGGSTNSVLHLLAIAAEARLPLNLKDFQVISQQVPHICNMQPGGPHSMVALYHAGGIPAVLSQLSYLLEDATTVSGSGIKDKTRGVRVKNETIICSPASPVHPTGGLTILSGSLAPDGAVVKSSAVDPAMWRHRGPARVFEGEDTAMEIILNGGIEEGDVVIIRNEGPVGGPGMPEMLSPTSALVGRSYQRVALVTDGRFSGGTRGPCIGHVAPEAAIGGPIGLVHDGDIIQIDLHTRKIDLMLEPAKLEKRQRSKRPFSRPLSGVLSRYAATVGQADHGAVVTTAPLTKSSE